MFFKELIDIYSKETKKIGTDIDKIRVKLKKVEDEISKKQSENKTILRKKLKNYKFF